MRKVKSMWADMTKQEKAAAIGYFYNESDNLYHWTAPLSTGGEYHSTKGYPTAQDALEAGQTTIS